MTTGVYKLKFAPGVEYIGKSVDIEQRWDEHQTNLLRNKAAAKMQAAYKQFGMPDTEILAVCHKDHIDFLEDYYIEVERPVLNTIRLNGSMGVKDFELVKRNEALLYRSTVEHLELLEECDRALEDAQQMVDALVAENTELRQEYNSKRVNEEAVQELIRVTNDFTLRMQEKEEVIGNLTAKLQRAELPWYRKLIS